MTRPRLLDLFCGAGGAAMGYHRAGFDVVGVDINPQPNYPFAFWNNDVMTLDIEGLVSPHGFQEFDAIHASPPCQFASPATHIAGDRMDHTNLIPSTRELLLATGLPYVIENVEAARAYLREPILICGSMFDPPLEVKRHRLFETNWPLADHPWPCRHKMFYRRYPITLSHKRRSTRNALSTVVHVNGSSGTMTGAGAEIRQRAMGIDWATGAEIAQAIPPAYTEFIGQQLLVHTNRADPASPRSDDNNRTEKVTSS